MVVKHVLIHIQSEIFLRLTCWHHEISSILRLFPQLVDLRAHLLQHLLYFVLPLFNPVLYSLQRLNIILFALHQFKLLIHLLESFLVLIIVSLDLGFNASFEGDNSLMVSVHLRLEVTLLLKYHLVLSEPPIDLLDAISSSLDGFYSKPLLSDLVLDDHVLLILLRIEALKQLQNLKDVFHISLKLLLPSYQGLDLVDHVGFRRRRGTSVRGL